ncbi:phosphatase PAP2 family protein [Pengzhenrongella frigida]|uniref:Phosphatase PAP2 family protein n=1 Tax=Pengzhenrongella frigida TaxID=1259133 RepID=A0A4Q5N451_9MICO|nr:phosphatase PAP2 family protein [Cellulomonas sp. HLT2-17]RYV52990.1 phosphatase PAP2 family protein [Cellulomonas sp. HLT2-17]
MALSLSVDSSGSTTAVATSRPRWWRELSFVGVIYLAYSLIRNGAPEQVARAQDNARSIVHLEHLFGLDVEHGINAFVASLPALAIPANYYYATLHLAVTMSVLAWLYAVRSPEYRRARSVLLTMTLLALVGYWLFPLAPPRLMTGGDFVDTVRSFSTWGVAPSAPISTASNQYAAMPSMHVGWALWSGITLAQLARTPLLRGLGAAYPATTLLVVVATGNHFLLDAVAALVLFVVAIVIVDVAGRARFGLSPAVRQRDGALPAAPSDRPIEALASSRRV